MIFGVEISAQAELDLRSIYRYIAYNLQSPINANGQLNRLEDCILSLKHMPQRFRAYEKEPWYSRGLRIMPVDNYCVLYITDKDKLKVTVIRVMYGGQDMDTQLQKHTGL